MQDYAEYAGELVERIDAGELEPSEVDIRPFVENDTDVLTPALRDRLEGTGKIEEYNQLVRQRDQADLRQEVGETQSEHSEALSRLRDPDDQQANTATLIQGTEIEVKTHTNGRIDRALQSMDEADTPQDVIDDIVIVINWFVVDEDLADPSLWYDYAEEYGAVDLMREAMRIMEPYFDVVDTDPVIQRFRGE